MSINDPRLKNYTQDELNEIFVRARFTHVQVYSSEEFQQVLLQYLPNDFLELYEKTAFHILCDFARGIALAPHEEPDYAWTTQAVFQAFFQTSAEYREQVGHEIYDMMIHVFGTRLVTNLYTVNGVDEHGKDKSRITVFIDLLPMELYDDVDRFNDFQCLRHTHEWYLNTIH